MEIVIRFVSPFFGKFGSELLKFIETHYQVNFLIIQVNPPLA
jgi:hypothetical protein